MSEDITRQPITVNFSGGASAQSVANDKAKVSSNDTTAGYLNGKLVAGTGIALTENGDADDETLSVSISYIEELWFDSAGDYKFVKNGTKIELWVQGTKVADWG